MPLELNESKRRKLEQFGARLLALHTDTSTLTQLMSVASVISDAFTAVGLRPPIIVGGLAVETYTYGDYATMDVDFVHPDLVASGQVMRALGFTRTEGGRYFTHPELSVAIEFPDDELDGSLERISEIELEKGRKVRVIGIEDIILDRVAAYVNWDKCREDSEHAVQAVTLLIAQHDRIDQRYLQDSARDRGWSEALRELQNHADAIRTTKR